MLHMEDRGNTVRLSYIIKRETSVPFVISQGVWTAITVPFSTYFLKGGASKKVNNRVSTERRQIIAINP